MATIRKVIEADLPTILSWRNHVSVRQYMLSQHEITLDEHRNWFQQVNKDSARSLLIVEKDNTAIGFVQFSNVKPCGCAEWGFYINPLLIGKGYGSLFGSLVLDYAFSDLNLHKVYGQTLASNTSSIRFHQKMGFVQEGTLRQHCLLDNQYYDLLCFGLLSDEWYLKRCT